MTVAELKTEANKLGYNIIKKQPYITLEPCECGHKPHEWVNAKLGFFYWCESCDIRCRCEPTPRKARIAWNEMRGVVYDNQQ